MTATSATPPARPSRPSIRFIALMTPTIQNIVNGRLGPAERDRLAERVGDARRCGIRACTAGPPPRTGPGTSSRRWRRAGRRRGRASAIASAAHEQADHVLALGEEQRADARSGRAAGRPAARRTRSRSRCRPGAGSAGRESCATSARGRGRRTDAPAAGRAASGSSRTASTRDESDDAVLMRIAVRVRSSVRARQYPVAQRQHVHARLEIAGQRVAGRRHDRLVLVEAGVEHQRHARLAVELGDQRVVARVGRGADGLQPPGVVDVGDRRDAGALRSP